MRSKFYIVTHQHPFSTLYARFVITHVFAALFIFFSVGLALANETSRFVGNYSGSADVENSDGTVTPRDMSVTISELDEGFTVQWSSVTYRDDGRSKEKSYRIDFVPADRGDGIFAAAMRRNVFGHAVQLDPMKGEPYVWSRIHSDTLTVYSLFVSEDGGYEMQQFDRTLVDGGLELHFKRIDNGVTQREVKTFLARD